MMFTLVILLALTAVESFKFRPNIKVNRNICRNLSNGHDGVPPFDSSLNYSKDENESIPSDGNKDENSILNAFKNLPEETKDDIKSTVISFAIALLVRLFIFEPRYIPSLSMYPTFDIGDQLIVNKLSPYTRGYQRRDVVVFNPSDTYITMTGNKEALIKRIVAVAGDTLEVKDNSVYVNGIKQEEPYTNEDPQYSLPPTTVPSGMVLVLGDNRNRSFDSHVWGLLPEKNIIGRAILKYWPPWRAGVVEGSM